MRIEAVGSPRTDFDHITVPTPALLPFLDVVSSIPGYSEAITEIIGQNLIVFKIAKNRTKNVNFASKKSMKI